MRLRPINSRSCRFGWLLVPATLLLLPMQIKATSVAKLHFYELVEKSSAVARLRCLSSQSYWDKGEIWTNTRFEVIYPIKGRLASVVTVRLLGGKLDHLASRVDGAPAFQPGEEVYLFLWGPPSENFGIVGWGQGTFRIRRDAATGMETVTQDSLQTPLFDPLAREYSRGGIQNMPVPEFLEKMRKEFARSVR